jgi:cytoskeletal protein RodZ
MAKIVQTSPGSSQDRLELKAFRRRKGVSLEQIADSTKISMRFLRAIEAEDYAVLPGGLFGRSYIRQYAEAAGCDAELLLERYRARCGGSEPGENSSAPRKPAGKDNRRSAPPNWLRAFGSIKS